MQPLPSSNRQPDKPSPQDRYATPTHGYARPALHAVGLPSTVAVAAHDITASAPSIPMPFSPAHAAASALHTLHNDPLLDVPDGAVIDELTKLMSVGIPMHRILDTKGRTPIHNMALRGSAALLRLALAAPATTVKDVNAQDTNKATALMLAARCVEPYGTACVSLLLKHGASVDPLDAKGSTVMHYAIRNAKVLDVLLDAGANINARDRTTGCTPIVLAVAKGELESVAVLLRSSAKRPGKMVDLDIEDAEHMTAEMRCDPRRVEVSRMQAFDPLIHPTIALYLREHRRRLSSATPGGHYYSEDSGVSLSLRDMSVYPQEGARSTATDATRADPAVLWSK